MPQTIRFHLDESVDPAVAEGLRRRGLDVTTSQEANLLGVVDAEQLAFALNRTRVFVTHDDDFLTLHAQGVNHAGMAYCHPQARSIGEIIRTLMFIHDCLDAEEMERTLEYL